MNLLDTAQIFRFHKELIKEYGEGTKEALGWKTPEGQRIRFEILSGIGDLNNCSVLDAGCGYGDLKGYLHEKYPQARYFGIEQIPGILQTAIDRYSHLPETVFFEGDFSSADLPAVDYILASGSLSYRNSDGLFIVKMIEKLFNSCRIGFGFNLSGSHEKTDGLLIAYNPVFIKEICLTLSDKVILKSGYYEDDFTIFMYH
jgi:SAM-dependent methyltransferase